MPCVLICLGYANGWPCEFAGQYLEWFKPNMEPPVQLDKWTVDLAKAQRFKDAGEALAEWKRERTVGINPRQDGKPNRPLTAFSVEVHKIDS